MIHIKYFIICISNLQVEPELPFPSKSALAKKWPASALHGIFVQLINMWILFADCEPCAAHHAGVPGGPGSETQRAGRVVPADHAALIRSAALATPAHPTHPPIHEILTELAPSICKSSPSYLLLALYVIQ